MKGLFMTFFYFHFVHVRTRNIVPIDRNCDNFLICNQCQSCIIFFFFLILTVLNQNSILH